MQREDVHRHMDLLYTINKTLKKKKHVLETIPRSVPTQPFRPHWCVTVWSDDELKFSLRNLWEPKVNSQLECMRAVAPIEQLVLNIVDYLASKFREQTTGATLNKKNYWWKKSHNRILLILNTGFFLELEMKTYILVCYFLSTQCDLMDKQMEKRKHTNLQPIK